MPASKAQQKATNKYISKAYDRINLTVPKGQKDIIQAHAAARGESVNAFIGRAIDNQMAQDAAGTPTRAVDGVSGILSLGTLEKAQEAAQKAGESVSAFVDRAIETQAKRDGAAMALRINPGTGDKIAKG